MSEQKTVFTIELDRKKALILGSLLLFSSILVYTYIVAILAFVAPSADYPLSVTSLTTLDTNNVTTSTYNAEETVRINITVEMALSYVNIPYSNYIDFTTDTTYRVIITIMDPNNKPVFFYNAQNTTSPQESQTYLRDYALPSNTAVGTYTIRVLLWSDWLPTGNALSPTVEEITFDV